ncbi:ImmA/IrrE family metallo-endopeptidase [Deinococcus depolymerans]|uniref:IrrE N-terminal-like domain-containing protein n=1 Tax=Deinococcus depolymerans TaxID=392408 RepID=A0ABN1BZH2_9DEIO
MDARLASLLDFAAELQARHDHPSSPRAFAQALGIRLIEGDEDSANAGPPAVVTYNARYGLGRRRFSLWHEMAHVIMGWHGIDADFDSWVGEMDREQLREQAASILAGQLMVPRLVVTDALREHGWTGTAVMHMRTMTGMSESVCLRRLISHEISGSRAAAVFVDRQVVDVATWNYRVPLRRYERIPEPANQLEGVRLSRMSKGRVIGLWEE